ncbi:hypothetical protein FACS1894211_01000 [Clostridia bacterium]|nr:hypothetical protein FACS1894211_01000 [Clostridia bacterium]
MKKISLSCMNCGRDLMRLSSCKDLTLTCPVCGAEILLNAGPEEAVVKIRVPDERRAQAAK